jgi:GT2 family glycosyltransferase
MADSPATITVSADGTTIFQGNTIPAAPLAGAPSHRVIRFEARFDLPHTAHRLDVRAGSLGQLLLASYEIVSADLVTEAARAAAAALLRLERGLGRHLGWDRGALAALRTAGDAQAALGRALSPIRTARTRGVSVIVPIYKGLDETRACLESLHANVLSSADPALREIILIDDRSPEPGMAELIAGFAGAAGQCEIQVISNPENLGFVGTVNHGISLAELDNDIILLNADTIVPPGFATRLQKAAQHDPRTASVTPLSNNATILSLPDANAVNDIGAADVPALDEFLRGRGDGETLEIPTGVGFCLFLARDALDDVGGFGMEWGRGYGEEVDWCLRARDRGWINIAALDIFVLHFGSVSFGTDERRAILERNHAQLERRYPEYITQVQAFLRTDALGDLRRAVFFHLLAKDSAPRLIHLLHGMGGGTMTFVDSIAGLAGAQGWTNLVVMPRRDDWLGRDEFEISWTGHNISLRTPPEELPGVLTELGKVGCAEGRILVHAIIGIGPALYESLANNPLSYSVVMHDFQWFCPRVVLVDPNGRYCGEPSPRFCQTCIQGQEIYDFGTDNDLIRADIRKWLDKNAALLKAAASVVAPSRDSAQRLQAHFDLPPVRVLPHPEPIETACITRAPDNAAVTRIAIVGGINIAKGAAVIRDLARHAAAQKTKLTLRVIGDIVGREALGDFPNLETTGRYTHADLPRVLRDFDPHFVFFPGVWPETYCYVLSEIWALGYPAVCLDIGAIAERVRETGAGLVLPYDHEAELLLPRLLSARAEVAKLTGHRFRIGIARPDLGPLLGALGGSRRPRRRRV